MLLCALLALIPHAHAQEPTVDEQLQALHAELEQAQFARATRDSRSVLARVDLRAHQRNEALELLAIAQIAARDDAGAQDTLRELFMRDPAHTPKVHDPGPQVEAAFARARIAPRTPLEVPVATGAVRDDLGRLRIAVSLGAGRDAIERIDVFASGAGEATHLVAEVGTEARLALTLPALNPELLAGPEPRLAVHVEARAPSGYVLGRDGTDEVPLQVQLEPAREPPARKSWWLWASVAIAVLGIGIGAAIAAH